MDDMETRVYLEEADVKKDFFDCKENNLKCPFCQQELVRHWGMKEPALYCCDNPKCSRGGVATESSWQELIRTRKALDVAKNAINSAVDHNIINCVARGIDPRTDDTNVTLCGALEQITALEQKDK